MALQQPCYLTNHQLEGTPPTWPTKFPRFSRRLFSPLYLPPSQTWFLDSHASLPTDGQTPPCHPLCVGTLCLLPGSPSFLPCSKIPTCSGTPYRWRKEGKEGLYTSCTSVGGWTFCTLDPTLVCWVGIPSLLYPSCVVLPFSSQFYRQFGFCTFKSSAFLPIYHYGCVPRTPSGFPNYTQFVLDTFP